MNRLNLGTPIIEESSSTHPTHYTKSTTVVSPTPPPQPTLTTYQKQKKAEPTLPKSLTNDMEEDKLNSDIEFEDEEVEEEGDVYLLEDNEDEVLEGDKEYFSNSDPEALEIVEPAKKVPEEPMKVKGKDDPNWMHPVWDLHKAHNKCQGPNFTFVIPKKWKKSFPIMSRKGGAGFYHTIYIYYSRDEGKDHLKYNCQYEGRDCPMRLTTEDFDKFVETNAERAAKNKVPPGRELKHTCNLPNDLLRKMFFWFLRQYVKVSGRKVSSEVVTSKLRYVSKIQEEEIGTFEDIQNYFSSIGRKARDMKSKSNSLKTLTVTLPLQVTLKGSQFPLFDTGSSPKS